MRSRKAQAHLSDWNALRPSRHRRAVATPARQLPPIRSPGGRTMGGNSSEAVWASGAALATGKVSISEHCVAARPLGSRTSWRALIRTSGGRIAQRGDREAWIARETPLGPSDLPVLPRQSGQTSSLRVRLPSGRLRTPRLAQVHGEGSCRACIFDARRAPARAMTPRDAGVRSRDVRARPPLRRHPPSSPPWAFRRRRRTPHPDRGSVRRHRAFPSGHWRRRHPYPS